MSLNTDHSLHSLPAFPTRTVLGVKFFSGSLKEATDHSLLGGLVVAPSGPGLANDLPRDPAYRDALLAADLVLPDSGLMVLWWNRSHSNEKEKLPRLSGLLFLKELIKREAKGVLRDSFWIMPDAGQDADNGNDDHQFDQSEARIKSFHTAILNQNHWWHDWDECGCGVYVVCTDYSGNYIV